MMSGASHDWLHVERGDAPLIVAFPHTGTVIPDEMGDDFVSLWQARRDADWWIDDLYAFAGALGATTIRTDISRSVIDVNRDPLGGSLYPGQFTTGLCPTTDFDGAALYRTTPPDDVEIQRRRAIWFDPYHAAIEAEVARLRGMHDRIVVYDAHSIRSIIPSLFDDELPHFNIGTAGGTSCGPELAASVSAICAASDFDHVVDGRFKGGWTTRRYGRPVDGVHAIQMELAQRGYMAEPAVPTTDNWPGRMSDHPIILPTLRHVIDACLSFAKGNQ